MKSRSCSECKKPFETSEIERMKERISKQELCNKCTKVLQKRQQELFAMICPPLYRGTDPFLLNPKIWEAVLNWEYGPKGLGLVGISGIGKTRAAYLILKRMSELGYKVQALNAIHFSKLCFDKFIDNREIRLSVEKQLTACYEADVLLLDDLGRERMSEYCEVEFYTILEYRTSHMIPTLWTTNASSETLRGIFSENQSESLMRRLTQFSNIVAIWEKEDH